MAGLEPLDAGKVGVDLEHGRGQQRLLMRHRQREAELWADAGHLDRFAKLANDLEQQAGLNGKMRQILVDWLLELHWNAFEDYMQHQEVVHLAVQLADRYVATHSVQRSHYQAVGAIAFGIACAAPESSSLRFTERHRNIAQHLQGEDMRVTKEYLIYMCAHAVTAHGFDRIEGEMLCCLRDAPLIPVHAAQAVRGAEFRWGQEDEWGCSQRIGAYEIRAHPRPSDFVARFAEAAGLSWPPAPSPVPGVGKPLFTRHGDSASVLVLLMDALLVTTGLCQYRASHQCAGCIMATRLLARTATDMDRRAREIATKVPVLPSRVWTPRLEYYTGYTRQQVEEVAWRVIDAAAGVTCAVVAAGTESEVPPDSPQHTAFHKRYPPSFIAEANKILLQAAQDKMRPAVTQAQRI